MSTTQIILGILAADCTLWQLAITGIAIGYARGGSKAITVGAGPGILAAILLIVLVLL